MQQELAYVEVFGLWKSHIEALCWPVTVYVVPYFILNFPDVL